MSIFYSSFRLHSTQLVQRNPSEREVANPSAPARNLKDLLGEEESRNGEKNHM